MNCLEMGKTALTKARKSGFYFQHSIYFCYIQKNFTLSLFGKKFFPSMVNLYDEGHDDEITTRIQIS
jgi:hypothetical protein